MSDGAATSGSSESPGASEATESSGGQDEGGQERAPAPSRNGALRALGLEVHEPKSKPAPSAQPAAREKQTQPAARQETQTKPQEQKQAQELFDIVVNGKTVKVSKDDLIKSYSKSSAADELFSEAAKKRKEVEEFYRLLEEDPEQALANAKIDKIKLADKWYTEELEKELRPQKTAEQQRIDELEEELNSFRTEKEKAAKESEEKEYNALVESRREEISNTFMQAIAMSPLAKESATSAEVVREMAVYMRLCREAGYDVTPEDLAKHVEERFLNSYKSLVENLEGEDLINLLGKNVIKKLRAYDMAQLEARRTQKPPQTASSWDSGSQPQRRSFVTPRQLLGKK